jgi:phage host-nuclease inhibitor protein Gam
MTTKPKKRELIKGQARAGFVPQNREEVIQAIAVIGTSQRYKTRIEADMNDAIAKIKERYELEAEPHNRVIAEMREGVQIWCEANRDALTEGGKVKTASFASGEVRWRVTPPSVKIRSIETVLAALYVRGLGRFIRVKEEPNKEAMLAEPAAVANIPGITITQSEEFVIVPFETSLEEVV